MAQIEDTISDPNIHRSRSRVCDLGYLRQAYALDDGNLGFRCPGEPEENFVRKGGRGSDTIGKVCLCNGLLSTIGLGQTRRGAIEAAIVTAGVNFDFLKHVVDGADHRYSASQVIEYLMGEVAAP
ncbi:MAG: nitronate monooxygenase [Candidatus Pelagisphaera sp.]|jgi:nitronate monooxygenase